MFRSITTIAIAIALCTTVFAGKNKHGRTYKDYAIVSNGQYQEGVMIHDSNGTMIGDIIYDYSTDLRLEEITHSTFLFGDGPMGTDMSLNVSVDFSQGPPSGVTLEVQTGFFFQGDFLEMGNFSVEIAFGPGGFDAADVQNAIDSLATSFQERDKQMSDKEAQAIATVIVTAVLKAAWEDMTANKAEADSDTENENNEEAKKSDESGGQENGAQSGGQRGEDQEIEHNE